jgi:hypothetical protein
LRNHGHDHVMGFNRQKLEDQRREAAEKEAASALSANEIDAEREDR